MRIALAVTPNAVRAHDAPAPLRCIGHESRFLA